jgi:hypothetical protein
LVTELLERGKVTNASHIPDRPRHHLNSKIVF